MNHSAGEITTALFYKFGRNVFRADTHGDASSIPDGKITVF